jgi:hypothetical protein
MSCPESDLRGLTFREAINRPHLVGIHWCFFIVTMMFVWTCELKVELALLAYWAFDFGVIWSKWHFDNKPRTPWRPVWPKEMC